MYTQSLIFQLTTNGYCCKRLEKLNTIDSKLIKKEKQMTKAELIEKMAKDAGIEEVSLRQEAMTPFRRRSALIRSNNEMPAFQSAENLVYF